MSTGETKVRDLAPEAVQELREEHRKARMAKLKERLRELQAARKVVEEMEQNLRAFMAESVDDEVFFYPG